MLEETSRAIKEYQEHGDQSQIAGTISHDRSMLSAPSNFAWPGQSGNNLKLFNM